jgi:hypothetical protein
VGSESTGFKQAPGDVVGEVPEAQGGAAEVLVEAPVDRFGRAVAGTGVVEERKNVGRALLQGAAEASDLDERCRDAAGDRVDYGLHQLPR